MTNALRRGAVRALAGLLIVAFAGCGEREPASSDPEVAIPTATATPAASEQQVIDGYLLSADERQVVLQTVQGRRKFLVAPEDLDVVGIPHLTSHAGLTDVGFRVFYEEKGGKRYIKGSQEIPPPPLG